MDTMNETTRIKRQFYHSLKRGTGEAYLIAKKYQEIDFSSYLIKGVLNNFAYDGQTESSRAKYIFDIIAISKNQGKIRNAVLDGLKNEQCDTWNLTHIFDLAKLYFEQGDLEFREAIYNRFLNNPIEGSDWAGSEEILDMDGLDGLIYIAEKFGEVIDQDPDYWHDDCIIQSFQKEHPNIAVIKELEDKAKTNKFIRLYLDCTKRSKFSWKRKRAKQIDIEDIVEELLDPNKGLSFYQKRNLSESELYSVGKRLLIEKDESNIGKLLDIFTEHKFPFDGDFILTFAKRKSNPSNGIKEYAIEALKFLKSDSIRNFALERIRKSRNPATFTDILMSNYESGDFQLLSDIANKFNDEHIIEGLANSYSDIYNSNNTKECKEPLEVLYSKMNCGIHRNEIVKILIKNNVLSKKIREEIKFDSYLETRELIE